MYFITGDRHSDFRDIMYRVGYGNINKGDTIIVLGDSGFNYYMNDRDSLRKKIVNNLGVTFFCIHGNHEERPSNIPTYKTCMWNGGKVYYEEKYPNLLFAKDGEFYNINGLTCVVIGGAYSVDKMFRLSQGYQWFKSEQLTASEKANITNKLKRHNNTVDCVFTHTCPKKYEPTEWFMRGVNQAAVDKSMELWLDKVEERLNYSRWYCGHYHGDKHIDNVQFLYKRFQTFGAYPNEFVTYYDI